MKKIAIMLLAALMLFAFVACDDTTKTDGATLTVSLLGEEGYLGATQDKYGDYEIAADGTVTGSIYKQTLTEYWPDAANKENEGYFFAFVITNDFSEDATMTFQKGDEEPAEDKTDMAFEAKNVFKIAAEDKTGRVDSWKVTVKDGDETYSITFDLTDVDLTDAPEA